MLGLGTQELLIAGGALVFVALFVGCILSMAIKLLGTPLSKDSQRISELEKQVAALKQQQSSRRGDSNSAPPSPFESVFSASTSSNGDEIHDLLRRGLKIEAVKLYRKHNPASGLKEAKEAVEAMQKQMK